eukprot:13593538-Alexandrium_andersonii.AAC.1
MPACQANVGEARAPQRHDAAHFVRVQALGGARCHGHGEGCACRAVLRRPNCPSVELPWWV